MARWSSEYDVAEYRDLQASAMSVDSTGQLALLAGRRTMALVDLNDIKEPKRKFSRQGKWEVSGIEWSPLLTEKLAVACNQKIELFSCRCGDLALLNTLKAHTRVISDLNWSPFEPNYIASCSIDTFIYLWDVRDARKPSSNFNAVAGAGQVKWNLVDRNLLATSHEGDIRIWDLRKDNTPVQYIAAHLSKIHGLAWSPTLESQLVTASQDCTVKFWDINNPRMQHEYFLNSGAPVWRARFTPFGNGLITVVVPQLRRGENSLLLWSGPSAVHTFVGHTDVVLEFEWRKKHDNEKNFQLVTWSRDQSLRIWKIDSYLQKLCHHNSDEVIEQNEQLGAGNDNEACSNDDNAFLKSSKLLKSSIQIHEIDLLKNPCDDNQSQSLQQEFLLLNRNIQNMRINNMDVERRKCIVEFDSNGNFIKFELTFPERYPFNCAPLLSFCAETTIDAVLQNKLTQVLKATSLQYVRKNKSCLEPCLRQLVSTLEAHCIQNMGNLSGSFGDKSSSNILHAFSQKQAGLIDQADIFGTYQNTTIPFPKTCGARFGAVGILVCFNNNRGQSDPNSKDVTPRALSALTLSYQNRQLHSDYGLVYNSARFDQHAAEETSYGIATGGKRAKSSNSSTNTLKSSDFLHDTQRELMGLQYPPANPYLIVVYDASALLCINRDLAERYIAQTDDLSQTCMKNAVAGAINGRKDLVQIWSLMSVVTTKSSDDNGDEEDPWSVHPFGKQMLTSIIKHYLKIGDVQTVALICCIGSSKRQVKSAHKKGRYLKSFQNINSCSPGGSPYHTIHAGDNLHEALTIAMYNQGRINRSNSWSESLDEDYRAFQTKHDVRDAMADNLHYRFSDGTSLVFDNEPNNILDPEYQDLYDEIKAIYADILYRWNLLHKRAEVLKHMYVAPPNHKGIEFVTNCFHCQKVESRQAACISCKKLSMVCSICRIGVRGCANFCLVCSHGGHTSHMNDWFKFESVCPTGCGCQCLELKFGSNIFS